MNPMVFTGKYQGLYDLHREYDEHPIDSRTHLFPLFIPLFDPLARSNLIFSYTKQMAESVAAGSCRAGGVGRHIANDQT